MKKIIGALIALYSAFAFSATLVPVQLLNPTGSSSGQAIVSTGASSAPGWSNVSATSLAAIAANTVVANVTGSSASPTAFAMPACATALEWTAGTGFVCNSAGAFITLSATTSGSSASITVTDTGANGANIKLVGNGGTTPNKSIRANGGLFQLLNSAYSTVIFQSDDSGNVIAVGSVTPSQTGGIVGTTTNNNANAGSMGEFPIPTNLTNVSLTNATTANVSSVSLTAGDWEVSGVCAFIQAGTTIPTEFNCGVSTTSATLGAFGTYASTQPPQVAGFNTTMVGPVQRILIASTTTVYLVVNASFSTSTMTANGYLHIRRNR